MVQVTADDIRVLAQSGSDEPVLALVDDRLEVVPTAQVDADSSILYTRAALVEEYGEEITDIEAQLAAANLTASLTDDR